MKIIALVKQVPDSTEIRVDKVTGTLIRAGVPSIINPDDLAGVEEALKIKETKDDVTVTVISMGPPQASGMLKELLARGVDECVLITDRAFAGADTGRPGDILQPYLPGILLVDKRKAGTDPPVWDIGIGSVLFPF